MKKQLLIILIAIWSINGYSQIKYETGYFVSNDGSRFNCLIKNIDWKNNPKEFTYKLSENADPSVADIKSVVEFGISDFAIYKRFTINVDRSSEVLSQLSTNRNPEFTEEELFLKVLVEGKATLYSYEEGDFRKYFFKMDSSVVEQLIFKSYSVSRFETKENNSFRQQLVNNLKCEKISSADIEKINYTINDLVKIFNSYNECQNSGSKDYEKKANRDNFNLSVRPGLNHSSLVFNSPSDALEIDFGKKLTVRFGIEVETLLPFNKNKWAIIIEPTYQYFKSEITSGNRYFAIDYKSIELPIGIRYYIFLNENSKFYLNSSYVIDFDFYSEIVTVNGTWNEISSRPNWAFGLGYTQNNKYTLELRYGLSRDIIRDPNFNSDYKTISFILGYKLF